MPNRILAASLVACLGAAAFGSAAFAGNLVPNGGFEAGNTGFASAYGYQTDLLPAGVYAIGSNPQLYNPNWSDVAQPHSGSSMMIVNGADVAGVNVWTTGPLTVTPNTTYYFGAFVTSIYPVSPAVLDFSINGTQIGADFSPTSTVGQWSQFYVPWNSGASTSATIALVNQNTAFTGNDFALDDISLGTTAPIPEPASVAVLGLALAGLGAARRRR